METFTIQLLTQKVSKSRVAASHKHILVRDALDLHAVSVQPDKDPQDHHGSAGVQACIFPAREIKSP